MPSILDGRGPDHDLRREIRADRLAQKTKGEKRAYARQLHPQGATPRRLEDPLHASFAARVESARLRHAHAGFSLVATRGTAAFLEKKGFTVEVVNKVNEGRPHCVDRIRDGGIQLVVNTSALGVHEIGAAYELRRATLLGGVCYFTTLTAARAAAAAILELQRVPVVTHCLQDRPAAPVTK